MPRARKLQVIEGGQSGQRPRPWEKPIDGRPCKMDESNACWAIVVRVLAGQMKVSYGLDQVHRILGTKSEEDLS